MLLTKVGVGIVIGYVLGHTLGVLPIQSGWLAGISTLAVVAAFNDTNGGLYVALMEQYGRPEDAGAYCMMALESGPFFTMITLGVAGLSSFPWQTLVGAILPLFIGMALGNLDDEFRVLLPDVGEHEALQDVAAAEDLRLQALAPAAELEDLVDQELHRVHAVATRRREVPVAADELAFVARKAEAQGSAPIAIFAWRNAICSPLSSAPG